MSFNPHLAIFVFGSNRAGIHGAGAAKYALEYKGAKMGIGEGISGGSYALPTKRFKIEPMTVKQIAPHVANFIEQAQFWYGRGAQFQVTRVGCGLGGHEDEDIAPLFVTAPDNCWFDNIWRPYLGERFRYWGTFP
jgi:hypothetical protein